MDHRDAISALVYEYASRLDNGDLAGVADLFADSSYGPADGDVVLRGAAEVRQAMEAVIRLYDGSPCTHHNITNLIVEVAEQAETATARSYYTVIQAIPGSSPRIILTGRYEDRFQRTEGAWRFAERRIHADQVGDLSDHLDLSVVDFG